jgi:hypothetical protein
VREVEITLYLREELVDYVMDAARAAYRSAPPITSSAARRANAATRTGSATGCWRGPPRARAKPRADRAGAAAGDYAALAAADLGDVLRDDRPRPEVVAAQIGHVNPKFTFSVYQQVATRRYIDEQAVWNLMRFADEPRRARVQSQIARLQPEDPRGSVSIERGVRPGARSLSVEGDEP